MYASNFHTWDEHNCSRLSKITFKKIHLLEEYGVENCRSDENRKLFRDAVQDYKVCMGLWISPWVNVDLPT